jgi:transposase
LLCADADVAVSSTTVPIRSNFFIDISSEIHPTPVEWAFHNRLADADKKSKVIMVAVMRKMITTLNAMLRDNAVWPPQSA